MPSGPSWISASPAPGPRRSAKLRADLEAARAAAANADRHAERTKALLTRKLISPQDAEDAAAANQAARGAGVKAAQAGLDLGLAGSQAEDIAAAAAQLAALQADLAQAQLNLQHATLMAPTAGIVQNRILELGDMASAQRPVLTIALTQPLWARVYLAEPDLGRVKQGQPALVYSDSFPGRAYPGWVGYIAPERRVHPQAGPDD